MGDRKAVIKYTNMDNRMVEFAINTAAEGFDRYEVSKEIADHIKRTFDKKYERTWHCVVGKDFGRLVP